MRLRLHIKGKVQGVGFRFFTVQEARKLSLTGWVRNLPGGDVEAEAQGDEIAISKFLGNLKTAHPWARVDSIQEERLPDKSGEAHFDIED